MTTRTTVRQEAPDDFGWFAYELIRRGNRRRGLGARWRGKSVAVFRAAVRPERFAWCVVGMDGKPRYPPEVFETEDEAIKDLFEELNGRKYL
jgi:hypothetical protein